MIKWLFGNNNNFEKRKGETLTRLEILNWIKRLGISGNTIGPNHWLIELEHKNARYSISVQSHGRWFIYAAKLIDNIQGENAAEFYQRILNFNSTLNFAYIAIENHQLVLIRNDFTEDINENNFVRGLVLFHRTHESVYGYILEEATKLGIKYQTGYPKEHKNNVK